MAGETQRDDELVQPEIATDVADRPPIELEDPTVAEAKAEATVEDTLSHSTDEAGANTKFVEMARARKEHGKDSPQYNAAHAAWKQAFEMNKAGTLEDVNGLPAGYGGVTPEMRADHKSAQEAAATNKPEESAVTEEPKQEGPIIQRTAADYYTEEDHARDVKAWELKKKKEAEDAAAADYVASMEAAGIIPKESQVTEPSAAQAEAVAGDATVTSEPEATAADTAAEADASAPEAVAADATAPEATPVAAAASPDTAKATAEAELAASENETLDAVNYAQAKIDEQVDPSARLDNLKKFRKSLSAKITDLERDIKALTKQEAKNDKKGVIKTARENLEAELTETRLMAKRVERRIRSLESPDATIAAGKKAIMESRDKVLKEIDALKKEINDAEHPIISAPFTVGNQGAKKRVAVATKKLTALEARLGRYNTLIDAIDQGKPEVLTKAMVRLNKQLVADQAELAKLEKGLIKTGKDKTRMEQLRTGIAKTTENRETLGNVRSAMNAKAEAGKNAPKQKVAAKRPDQMNDEELAAYWDNAVANQHAVMLSKEQVNRIEAYKAAKKKEAAPETAPATAAATPEAGTPAKGPEAVASATPKASEAAPADAKAKPKVEATAAAKETTSEPELKKAALELKEATRSMKESLDSMKTELTAQIKELRSKQRGLYWSRLYKLGRNLGRPTKETDQMKKDMAAIDEQIKPIQAKLDKVNRLQSIDSLIRSKKFENFSNHALRVFAEVVPFWGRKRKIKERNADHARTTRELQELKDEKARLISELGVGLPAPSAKASASSSSEAPTDTPSAGAAAKPVESDAAAAAKKGPEAKEEAEANKDVLAEIEAIDVSVSEEDVMNIREFGDAELNKLSGHYGLLAYASNRDKPVPHNDEIKEKFASLKKGSPEFDALLKRNELAARNMLKELNYEKERRRDNPGQYTPEGRKAEKEHGTSPEEVKYMTPALIRHEIHEIYKGPRVNVKGSTYEKLYYILGRLTKTDSIKYGAPLKMDGAERRRTEDMLAQILPSLDAGKIAAQDKVGNTKLTSMLTASNGGYTVMRDAFMKKHAEGKAAKPAEEKEESPDEVEVGASE